MTFRFKRGDATVTAGLRRISGELCAETLAVLKSDDNTLDFAIHEARKTIKKLRGMVRLVRPRFKDARDELDRLRQAAIIVAPLRDTAVILATFDRLAAGNSTVEELRAPLEAAHQAARDPLVMGKAVASFADSLRAIRARSRHWSLSRDGFSALSPGLIRTWTDARIALADTEADRTSEAIHTLRKRLKDHWYQARLLEGIAPDHMRPIIAVADTLGETLGQIHDLDVVMSMLPATAAASDLRARAADERSRLVADAIPMASAFLATEPDVLAAEWQALWKAWRD